MTRDELKLEELRDLTDASVEVMKVMVEWLEGVSGTVITKGVDPEHFEDVIGHARNLIQDLKEMTS
jgi:hypothetical protein